MASRDDRYADFGRLEELARRWGSRFVDAGYAGHINAKSRLGYWDDGETLLEELIDKPPQPGIGRAVDRQ